MNRSARGVGSGTVVGLGVLGTAIALVATGRVVGWNATWRAFGVTPLLPPFFDMRVINDYAACAWRGVDPYAPHACNVDNFNIPPTWLWFGYFGLDGTDSAWLSAAIIAAAAIVMTLLFKGRPWWHGVVALAAMISPSVMMGVERGNLDLLILSLVGLASLIYDEGSRGRAYGAIAFLVLGVALKLFPMFCVSVAARFSKQTFLLACALATLSSIYLVLTLQYLFLIGRNVPTTFVLSYGYKAIFLGVDHIRHEAGLNPSGLTDTWVPVLTVSFVLICAIAVALNRFLRRSNACAIGASVAGTAFLFGAGIYCGTYLLGTNFIYRLMFLLLCFPQALDWQSRSGEGSESTGFAEAVLLIVLLGVLWSNGDANGHETFLLLPQLLDWLLFFCLTAVLMLNLLRTWARSIFASRVLQTQ